MKNVIEYVGLQIQNAATYFTKIAFFSG
ncbi:hypothetical protein QTG54_005421 [Skeletonema marinoi]|uniref:Uncharacterized protein n=1 Tax=Skeletonema marinoi TaxID=267567 RepID=A0AAD8YDY6_9STRA|nr:hypothetical protein QTG54_005421 [Skeletonema marinoi]